MSAQLARLGSDEPRSLRRRRKAHRKAVACTAATLGSSRGDTGPGMVTDVSTDGCCVVSDAPWLRTGGFVSIGIAGEPPLQAIVRWVRDGMAGMEFLGRIPPDRQAWLALANA